MAILPTNDIETDMDNSIVYSKRDILSDLRGNLRIQKGDIIGVHSSMKSLGKVDGGPTALIEALIEAVGAEKEGTVLMPCFNGPDDVVNLKETECRLGLVPETFRKYPGVIRSENHTHSVAVIGKYAHEIAEAHKGRAQLGENSPFHELAKRGGYIIHIGCNMKSSSIIHVAESIAKMQYLKIAYPAYNKDITLITMDGNSYKCQPIENPGCSYAFTKVEEELFRTGLILKAKICNATSLKALGMDVIETAVQMLKKDPTILLCDSPNCPVCPTKKLLTKLKNA